MNKTFKQGEKVYLPFYTLSYMGGTVSPYRYVERDFIDDGHTQVNILDGSSVIPFHKKDVYHSKFEYLIWNKLGLTR